MPTPALLLNRKEANRASASPGGGLSNSVSASSSRVAAGVLPLATSALTNASNHALSAAVMSQPAAAAPNISAADSAIGSNRARKVAGKSCATNRPAKAPKPARTPYTTK